MTMPTGPAPRPLPNPCPPPRPFAVGPKPTGPTHPTPTGPPRPLPAPTDCNLVGCKHTGDPACELVRCGHNRFRLSVIAALLRQGAR